MTGAIGFVKNGYTLRPDSSEAKRALAAHLAEKVSHYNLGANTAWGRDRFTVWNFQLRK